MSRSTRRTWVIVGATSLLLILLAAVPLGVMAIDIRLPETTGPFAVARIDRTLSAEGREEEFTADPHDVRDLPAIIYYPAAASGPAGPYVPDHLIDPLWRATRPFALLPNAFREVETNVQLGAHASLAGPFPTVIFSPGLGVHPQFYSSLLSDVASHGFIVVAIAHPYSTPGATFPDGRMIAPIPAGAMEGARSAEEFEGMQATLARTWTEDIRMAVDALTALNATDDILSGIISTGQVATMGHSIGGAAAAAAARADARIGVSIDMDGTLFGDPAATGTGKASMLIEDAPEEGAFDPRGARDALGRETYVASGHPGYRVTIDGMTHETFETDTTLFADAMPFLDERGARPARGSVDILRAYVVAMLQTHMAAGPGAALRPDAAPQGVTVQYVP